MDKELGQKVLAAVQKGNKRVLNSLLGCHIQQVDGVNLSPPSHLASILFHEWQENVLADDKQYSASTPGRLSMVHEFQALLMIHPSYSTPWMALAEMAKGILHLSKNELYHCVSSVSLFLRDASSSLPSQASGCEQFILLAVKEVMDRLLEESCSHQTDRTLLLCDLIRIMFAFTKHNLSSGAYEQLQHLVFRRDSSLDNVSEWLQLAQTLSAIATPNEMNMVKVRVLEYLNDHGSKLSVDVLMTLLDASMEIAKTRDGELDARSLQKQSSWYQVPLCVLIAAQHRMVDFVALLLRLSYKLNTYSTKRLSDFYEALEGRDGCPEWIQACLLLTLCQHTRRVNTKVVEKLFPKGWKRFATTDDKDITGCSGRLLELLFPAKETKHLLGLSDVFTSDKALIVEVLGDVSYEGAGRFVDANGSSVYLLTQAGKLLLKLIEPNNSIKDTNDANCTFSERMSTAVLELVKTLLDDSSRSSETRVMMFSATALTVLYNEVQQYRQQICILIQKGLLWQGADGTRKQACLAAASLIIGSVGGATHGDESEVLFLTPCLQWVTTPIDAETFMYLVACLASTRLVTKTLLQTSKTLVSRSDATSSANETDGGLIRAGLFGLLEIVRVSSWQDDEREAWLALSDCLVMDVPHVGLKDRQWIYQQIEDVLNDGDMGEIASKHFLRAIIIRVAKFIMMEKERASYRFVPANIFIVWEDSSSGRIEAEQTEDIVGLLRLSLSLLFNAGRVVDSSRSALQSQGHDLLMQVVLEHRGRGKKAHSKVISNMLKSWGDGCGADPFSIHLVTVVAYLAAIFQYLLRTEKSFSARPVSEDFETLEDCLSFVLSQERQSLDRCSGDGLPLWSTVAVIDHLGSKESDVDSESMALVHVSLCEFLVKILGGGALRTIRDDSLSLDTCRSMVLVVGFMLQLRQKLVLRVTQERPGDNDVSLEQTILTKVAAEFFPAASRVVQDLIKRNASLHEAEEYLQSIVLYCQTLADTSDDLDATAWSRDLQSVWVLYQVLSSEKGATDMIKYLESNVRVETLKGKADTSICSLTSVRSSADVDESIRGIRLSVLKAMEKLLNHANNSTGSNNLEIAAQAIVMNENCRNGESEALLVTGVLRAIALDLRKGLEGQSGGITAAMYEAYLASIRSCGGLMLQLTSGIEASAWDGVLSVIVEVTSLLREIMRSFPLEDASLFRSSLIMAIADLPSLLRHMLRNFIVLQTVENTIQRHLGDPANDMVTALFDDCLDILSRWSTLRDPNSLPWEDIAGRIHLEEPPAQCFGSPQLPFVGAAASCLDVADGVRDDKGDSRRVEMSLRTKEIWSWALSCTFVAWEENWFGSYQAALACPTDTVEHIKGVPHESVQFLLDYRKSELNLSLRKASELFSATVNSGSRVQQVALDMLAMNLPSAPRFRFCHFLASVTKVLIHSTQQLLQFLNAESSIGNKRNLITIGQMEALGSLCAWLQFDDQNADFTVGIYRWLSILRRKRPHGHNTNVQTADLVPWVTKVSLLIRDLYPRLRNLERVLGRVPRTHPLEGVVRHIICGGLVDLHHLTTRKLRLLELTMPTEYSAPTLPDFPTLAVDDSTMGKRRRVRRHSSQLRPKKRATTQIARSRNRIVNAFMNLDRTTGDSEGASDAFIDLEDFLVEG